MLPIKGCDVFCASDLRVLLFSVPRIKHWSSRRSLHPGTALGLLLNLLLPSSRRIALEPRRAVACSALAATLAASLAPLLEIFSPGAAAWLSLGWSSSKNLHQGPGHDLKGT